MNKDKTRSGLFGVAALYLLYQAYGLFESRGDTDTTMKPTARILFISLFVLAAAALLVYAVRLWLKALRDEKQPPEDDTGLKQ